MNTPTNAPVVSRDLATLTALINSGKFTPEDMTEFMAVANQKKTQVAERGNKIITINKLIKELASPITKEEFIELLGADLIPSFAGMFGNNRAAASADGAPATTSTRKGRTKFHSDSGLALFVFPKVNEDAPIAPKPICQGRAFEAPDEEDEAGYAKVYTMDDLKDGKPTWKMFKNAQTVTGGLITYIDKDSYKGWINKEKKAEVEAYLATPAGKKELEIMLEWAEKGRKADKESGPVIHNTDKAAPAAKAEAPKADTKGGKPAGKQAA